MPALRFYSAYAFFALAAVALIARGPWVWLPALVVFVGVPLLDMLLGKARRDVEADSQRGFDLAVELWLPCEVALLGFALAEVTRRPPAGASEWAGILLALGIATGGGGITVAHELMHRRGKWHRALGEALMTLVLYPHFCIEHVLGHHRIVGTREDAATARRGESVFLFVPRSMAMGMRSAWRLETRRIARLREQGKRTLLLDRRLRYTATQLALLVAVGLTFGPLGLALFVGQALAAIILLELTDYIEHYGLERRVVDGRPERVRLEHSWNSNHALSSALLFNLTRHSDHHAEASRPYGLLRARPEAPELPGGYPSMMLLSLVPPLWFRVMNRRADAAAPRDPSHAGS